MHVDIVILIISRYNKDLTHEKESYYLSEIEKDCLSI